MTHRCAAHRQGNPLRRPGDKNGFGLAEREGVGQCRCDLLIAPGRHAGGIGKLGRIGFDDIDRSIAQKTPRLGVDNHQGCGLPTGRDQTISDHALAVVRDHNHAGALGDITHCPDQPLGDLAVGHAAFFQVDPQKLLIARYEAGLKRCRPRRIGDQEPFDTVLAADQPQGLVALGVTADQSDQRHLAAQRRDIAGDISRRAQHHQFLGSGQDRNRRLRRNPGDIAINKPIDHHVADTDHPDAFEGVQQLLQGREIHGHAGSGAQLKVSGSA